jgi:hypothetical protein
MRRTGNVLDIHGDDNGLARLDRRLETMLHRLDHFAKIDMGHVMSDWQTQDMHRHRPFTIRSRRKVQTKVRPHSLRETLGAKRFRAKLTGKRMPRRSKNRRPRWSTRPILRAELLDKLYSRMADALHSFIRW